MFQSGILYLMKCDEKLQSVTNFVINGVGNIYIYKFITQCIYLYLEKICDQLNKCVCYSDTESIIILRVWQMA
jgi:hypothetical protein